MLLFVNKNMPTQWGRGTSRDPDQSGQSCPTKYIIPSASLGSLQPRFRTDHDFIHRIGAPTILALLRHPWANVNRSATEQQVTFAGNNFYSCKTDDKSKLLTAILATGVTYLEHEYMASFCTQKLINYSKTTFLYQRPRAHTGSDAKVHTT